MKRFLIELIILFWVIAVIAVTIAIVREGIQFAFKGFI